METKKYNWIRNGLAKGIDPDLAIAELERIEILFGALTAENILNASTSDDTLFHQLFTWDDTEAAIKYRLSQARTILNNIEVKIISDGQEKHIPVYEIVSTPEGRSYKHISNFSKEDVLMLKNSAVKALNYWKNKLTFYKEFDSAIKKIDDAINEVENIKESTETKKEIIPALTAVI